jgi:hypothetical protein
LRQRIRRTLPLGSREQDAHRATSVSSSEREEAVERADGLCDGAGLGGQHTDENPPANLGSHAMSGAGDAPAGMQALTLLIMQIRAAARTFAAIGLQACRCSQSIHPPPTTSSPS